MSKELLCECLERIKPAVFQFAFVSSGKVYVLKTKTLNEHLISILNGIDKFLPKTSDDPES